MHAALQAFGDSTWERKFAALAEQASQVGLKTLQLQTTTLAEGSVIPRSFMLSKFSEPLSWSTYP